MISRLEIKGFKSLVDVSIELGAVNVFIGANGSGKSNLLEAVGVLSAIVSGSLEAESIRYRGVRPGGPKSFLSSFKDRVQDNISITYTSTPTPTDQRSQYYVEFGSEEQHSSKWAINTESLTFKNKSVILRTLNDFTYLGSRNNSIADTMHAFRQKSYAKHMMKFYGLFQPSGSFKQVANGSSQDLEPSEIDNFLDIISEFSIYTPSTPQLRGFQDDIKREPLGLGGSGLGQAVHEMMNGEPDMLGPFDIEDVYELIDWADSLPTDVDSDYGPYSSITGGPIQLRIGDRFMGETHKSVSLVEASEGALYVLFLLALVGHQQGPKLFAVDNFDQALHPRLARELTRRVAEQILADGSKQMLATTHNPLVLDGLDLLDDRIRLFTVDRDKSGASQVNRVQVTPELMARAEEGFSLSRLWNMGRLGGVPINF